MLDDKQDRVSKMVQNLELVQNVSKPDVLKVAGKDIEFARPADEFCRLLISEIPSLYKYVKIAARLKEVSEFSRDEIIADIDDYQNWLISKLSVLIEESELKKLLEK